LFFDTSDVAGSEACFRRRSIETDEMLRLGKILRALASIIAAQMALSTGSGLAESDRPLVPKKPAVVRERGLELPFDLKTEPGAKFHTPDGDKTPQALTPTAREHRPYIGLGVSRPIETGN
jgi:hypothetical protein